MLFQLKVKEFYKLIYIYHMRYLIFFIIYSLLIAQNFSWSKINDKHALNHLAILEMANEYPT